MSGKNKALVKTMKVGANLRSLQGVCISANKHIPRVVLLTSAVFIQGSCSWTRQQSSPNRPFGQSLISRCQANHLERDQVSHKIESKSVVLSSCLSFFCRGAARGHADDHFHSDRRLLPANDVGWRKHRLHVDAYFGELTLVVHPFLLGFIVFRLVIEQCPQLFDFHNRQTNLE
jgi:hypothetical protein